MDTNPALVQEGRRKLASAIPLVLIHDGGGTTFGYYTLGDLTPERELWAIHNPDFKRSRPYPLTMEEMAKNYINLIQSSGIKGPIYLGGEQSVGVFHFGFRLAGTDCGSVQGGHWAALSPPLSPISSLNPPPLSPSHWRASSSLSLRSISPGTRDLPCALLISLISLCMLRTV